MASTAAQSSFHPSSGFHDSHFAASLAADPVALVYAATNLPHTDWDMHVQLCDAINQIPSEGPRIINAIKSRISSQNLDVAIQSVVLLESVVKNCSAILPVLAAGNFMDQLVHALPKRVREPQKKSVIHFTSASNTQKKMEKAEKILLLIQSLANAFDYNKQNNTALSRWSSADREKMKVFSDVYHTLQRNGVSFPSPAEDENVPIITPAAGVTNNTPTRSAASSSKPAITASSGGSSSGSFGVYSDGDCKIAFESSKVLYDILLDAVRSSDGRSQFEVVSSLRSNDIASSLLANLRSSQSQFQVRLLEQQPSEVITQEIISVNEIILRVMQFYRAVEEGRTDAKTVESFKLFPNEAQPKASNSSAGSSSGSVTALKSKRRSKDDDEKKERPASKLDDQKTAFVNLLPLDLLAVTSAPNNAKQTSQSTTLNKTSNATTLSPAVAVTANSNGEHTPGSTPPESPTPTPASAPADPFLAIATKSPASPPALDSLLASSAAANTSSSAPPLIATPFDDVPVAHAVGGNAVKTPFDSVDAGAAEEDDDPFASIAKRK